MEHQLVWRQSAMSVHFEWADDSPVRIASVEGPQGQIIMGGTLPLVEIVTPHLGRSSASDRLVHTKLGERLRYVSHTEVEDGEKEAGRCLQIRLADVDSGVEVTVAMEMIDGIRALRAATTVRNSGPRPLVLRSVTSWVQPFGGFTLDASNSEQFGKWQLIRANSDWLAESRWTTEQLRGQHFPDIIERPGDQNPRGCLSAVSTGTWSTGKHLPVAAVVSPEDRIAWVWQVEHNGGWRWEVGEDIDGGYLALAGPTDTDHQWTTVLEPGDSFDSVPATIALGEDFTSGTAQLTAFRRKARRQHPDNQAMPVIFNDYMNTLMGDPTTEKLRPLVEAAASRGIEIFCIDAGWYDESGHWWDSVGEWKPSRTRFPGGLGEVTDHIRSLGMTAGLWLEPEVVGINSPMVKLLPPEAFLQRHGQPLVEHDRFHLDFRHPATVAHLNEVVDRLVNDFGVGYFKFDYNIDPGAGTDHDADSVGAGLLGHNRAYLAWIDSILDRHPALVLENCGSGAMRMDFAMLSRMQLQSTSDQRDFKAYPAIAAAAPVMMLPEQAANWAYPQPEMSMEEIAFCLANSMLGRFFLSGYLNTMSKDQLDLVQEAIDCHKGLRTEIRQATPSWPLGLPQWESDWVALGLDGSSSRYLTIWSRNDGPDSVTIELPELIGATLGVETVFPQELTQWTYEWKQAEGTLRVSKPTPGVGARVIRLTIGESE